MDADESCSPSLDHSDIHDPMIVAVESLDKGRKRKQRAEESDLLPLPKHFCLEKQASLPDSSCPSSVIESAECSYAMDDTKTGDETSSSASVMGPSLYMFKDSSYSTGSSSSSSGYATSSNIDQCCSNGNDKVINTQEYVEDLNLMEMICPEFAVEDLQEVLNPVGSYILSSARWSVNNQDSEEAIPKPTIDHEFEQYFSSLMM